MSRLRRCLRKQQTEGQTLVLFALMSLLLLAGLGLVLDAGVDYANRRIMQNAADIAALAGARAISRQNTVQPAVKTIVETTAVENGVPSADDVTCQYVDSSGNVIGDCDDHSNLDPIDTDATGVQVKVAETHTTMVMRAVGITSSGTAATARAQIQAANVILKADVLIAVCGLDTVTSDGTPNSIFNAHMITDPYAPIPSPPASPSPMPWPDNPATINESNYSYDWNQRDLSTGQLTPLSDDAPNFLIQGAGIAKCKKPDSWHGLIDVPDNTTSIEVTSGEEFDSRAINMKTGDLASGTGPYHTINGPQGCERNQTLTGGCIMVLPIIDNYRANGSDDTLYVRAWGAFMVSQSGTDYYGRLVKNYPLHADSTVDWSPDYIGPVTITLVKQN